MQEQHAHQMTNDYSKVNGQRKNDMQSSCFEKELFVWQPQGSVLQVIETWNPSKQQNKHDGPKKDEHLVSAQVHGIHGLDCPRGN